jgi:DNA-binding NarL/FixJ family response regulator
MTLPAPEPSPLVYVQNETLVALVGEPLALSDVSRLVIAKWDGLYAEALRTACVVAFEGTPVEVCRTGDALLKSLRTRPADVVMMGLTFPDRDGVDVLETIARERLATRVLLVSGRRDEHSLQALRTARFDGFVDPWTEDFDGVVGALRAVAAGRGYISASLQRSLLGRQPLGPLGLWLTPAEHQVFCVIGDGSDNAEAAERLGLSETTVLTHRRAIMRKLGVHSSAKLVLEAVRFGVVRVAPDGRIFRPGFERIIADKKARKAARGKPASVRDAG